LQILDGTADLVALDEKSLALRGKRSKAVKKQKTEDHSSSLSSPKSNEEHGSDNLITLIESSGKTDFQKRCLKALLQIPSGQFSTYGACPQGRAQSMTDDMYAAALAKYLESSPRAVGNAMRGNPFAPRVPCHRILAADRSIGGRSHIATVRLTVLTSLSTGFGGEWGNAGKLVNEKLELLRGEGVKFDSKGKVLGPVFTGYR
jgi:methylated-DNA-[protein]-cysteine S-methyltransferase